MNTLQKIVRAVTSGGADRLLDCLPGGVNYFDEYGGGGADFDGGADFVYEDETGSYVIEITVTKKAE